MKAVLLLALALSACSATDYPKSAYDRARDDAFDNAVAASMLSNYAARPRSCMNIGGIITCD